MSTGEKRLVAVLASSTAALLAACLFLISTRKPRADTRAALADPGLREELLRRLGDDALGIWDSHNDPEVGRVILPNLKGRIATGVPVNTNALGLREKEFALPKPAGMLRIVLLGDSFIQGFGVTEEDRVGAFLERYLREHASDWNGRLECLHVAVGGWDTIAECAYLRRMLSEIAPDLVLHFLVTNDLDDHAGARGFGAMSAFAPREPLHTDALVQLTFPCRFSSPSSLNYLLSGTDWESVHRYEGLVGAVARVLPLIRHRGARYFAISHFGPYHHMIWHFLKDVIEPEEFGALPTRLWSQRDLILSPEDQHWSRAGHELVARLVFTMIREFDLLPELHLQPWPEVEEPCTAELQEAWKAATHPPKRYRLEPKEGLSSLEPAHFTDLEWRHVYTGLDEAGRVSPFASFHLSRQDRGSLLVRGRALDRPELAGARVRVRIEGVPVGERELVPGEPFEARFPVPADVGLDKGLDVRLETSDYVYAGSDRQHCVSFVLERLALE